MAGGFKVDTTEFSRALRDLSARNDRSTAENLQRYARTTLSNSHGNGVIDITPPGGDGARGTAARRQGEAAIDRDLSAVFVPVKLKHQRKERWPDVEGIHDARFRSGSRFGKKLTRGRAQAYYVDTIKLRALRRLLFSRVGFLASGWLAAAQRLGVAVPNWIARHGTRRGTVQIQLSGPRKSIEITNHVPDNAPAAELDRRLQFAVDRATARIDRDFNETVQRDAQRAGFKASA